MFEHTYQTILNRAKPDEALIISTAEAMETVISHPRARRSGIRRPFALAAVCILLAALSVTAMAAAIPGFRIWLFGPESGLSPYLSPISESSSKDGIRMEILGAVGAEQSFSVYFTLQDQQKENRLDGSANVLAKAQLDGTYPASTSYMPEGLDSSTKVLSYDPETQTLFCKFSFQGTRNVENSTVSFRVERILSGGESYDYLPLDFPEETWVTDTVPLLGYQMYGESGEPTGFMTVEEKQQELKLYLEANQDGAAEGERKQMLQWAEPREYLKPLASPLPIDGLSFGKISGAGFIGGKLRIQILMEQEGWPQAFPPGITVTCADRGTGAEKSQGKYRDGDGRLNAKEYESQGYMASAYYAFSIQKSLSGAVSTRLPDYWEFEFDISPENLDDYEFYAAASAYRRCLEENWYTSFDLPSDLPKGMREFQDVPIAGMPIETLEITPMGVYLVGTRDSIGGIERMELLCGERFTEYKLIQTSRNYYETSGGSKDGDIYASAKYFTEGAPVDPQKVTALRIDGELIPLD